MEGLCQTAVEGLCAAAPWYDWLLPRTSGDVAGWAGALGSLIAVIVTIVLWQRDRRDLQEQHDAENKAHEAEKTAAAAEARQRRIASAFKQAVAVRAPLMVVIEKLTALLGKFHDTRTVMLFQAEREAWILPEFDHIDSGLLDRGAFELPAFDEFTKLLAGGYAFHFENTRTFIHVPRVGFFPATFQESYIDALRALLATAKRAQQLNEITAATRPNFQYL